MTPRKKAELFKGRSVKERVDAMAAGRVVWGEQRHVIAQMEAAVADAVAAERERIIGIIDKVRIPPAGLDRLAGAELAAFNMGRLHQAIIQAVRKGE